VKTKDIATVGLGVLLVLVLWHQFLYAPMSSQASKANAAAHDADTQRQALETQLRKITGGDASKQAAKKASADALQSAIPVDASLSNFLRSVNDIRDAVGIAAPFQTISPSPPTVQNGVATINVGIAVQGTYQQMRDYINRLNGLSRLVVIDGVSFTAGAATNSAGQSASGAPTGEVFAGPGSPPNISAQITARLFAQPAAAGLGTGANGATTRPVGASPQAGGVQNT
jgi:Tfp pilus assembly protein PilO